MNATRSFVPTPSALATSTGSRDAARVQAEEAAERSDLGEHARRERAARQRPDAADDFVAGVDVDPGLLVIHQNSSVWISASAIFRAGDPSGGCPVACGERSRRSAPLRDPLRACRTLRRAGRSPASGSAWACSDLQHAAACCAARRRRARARSAARAGSRLGTPIVDQHRRPRRRCPAIAERRQAGRDARSRSWKPIVLDRELQRLSRYPGATSS